MEQTHTSAPSVIKYQYFCLKWNEDKENISFVMHLADEIIWQLADLSIDKTSLSILFVFGLATLILALTGTCPLHASCIREKNQCWCYVRVRTSPNPSTDNIYIIKNCLIY